jgi:hypothetical protein
MSQHNYTGRGRGGKYYARPTSSITGGRDLYHEVFKLVLDSMDVPDDVPSAPDIVIKDLKFLGSYNWTEASQPTMIVPGMCKCRITTLSKTAGILSVENTGSPREWIDKPLPFQVPMDENLDIIDQNSYRMGKASLAPLIQSVEAIIVEEDKPDFDWSSVDFVTDRNGLRKLLRWASSATSEPCDDFRIDTQLAGKTVLLNRWEKKNREDRSGERKSYARNFEKVMTAHAAFCAAGTGYHRIVTYVSENHLFVLRTFGFVSGFERVENGRSVCSGRLHPTRTADKKSSW